MIRSFFTSGRCWRHKVNRSSREHLRRGCHVPVGFLKVHVAKIGSQVRQSTLNIQSFFVPGAESGDDEGVAERMERRLIASVASSDSHLGNELFESLPQSAVRQPTTMKGDEECGSVKTVSQ